ncbi:hypothetical protein Q5H91_13880 [Sphingomonas sp. KR1UV-12]|uniref:Uncharacterized protein n=1 Tax=Sphingomonas aurea TaxID=3063994 RepID=A0ABT9EMX4_9SPHN|nr:hypothetical protein [Sphingomonas sp. KR1UV-12]MDP1028308.1 hypothetical protein [Sphingomonas sp. KR1UV-12]
MTIGAIGSIGGTWPNTAAKKTDATSTDFADTMDAATATDTDPRAEDVAAAGLVSAAQGLPNGSYDFTRISPRQMLVVGRALVSGDAVSAPGIAGAMTLAEQTQAADTPVNFFAYLNQQAGANEKAPGGMSTAFGQRASLAVLTRVQSGSGVPIAYDDNYPTAPRAMTAEEANTKLKAAITAFRKEAALTPAQRIRRDVLKDMKLTEDDLKAMPEAEREVAEKKIGEEVARRLKLIGLAPDDGKPANAGRSAATTLADTGAD